MDDMYMLLALTDRFEANLPYYKDSGNAYNEQSCRTEYIDPFLQLLGWDVPNGKGLPPQYREVIAENYSTETDRPDYSLTLRGVAKVFVEAKKPAVDIYNLPEPALQARRYGWNANHRVVILTNFEYLIIYDTTIPPNTDDECIVARWHSYHFSEYCNKFDEIYSIISRNAVYSGEHDTYFDTLFQTSGYQRLPVDELFLKQINQWRLVLSNELYKKEQRYSSIDVLSDKVQEFINRIIFLRICEDKNLPLYQNLRETIKDQRQMNEELEKLFRNADRRYNSRLFSGDSIVFDLSSAVISEIIESLYYPQSPYVFSIIGSSILGQIYEMFLTEHLTELPDGSIGLAKKKECGNRSIVTTPIEIVKYMTEQTLAPLCKDKSPQDIRELRVADIACGSGVYLCAMFEYLQIHCVEWYLKNNPSHLIEIGNGLFKLPLEEKKAILCSCIYGVDIDYYAVEAAKFSLLVKLIENETPPSIAESNPILPDMSTNIFYGNALVGDEELKGYDLTQEELIDIIPFNWSDMNPDTKFDAIVGNPPYVNTENLHALLTQVEINIYKEKYITAHKQFDKYFIFLERAIRQVKENGYVCYIIPNKFYKVGAGKYIRQLIAENKMIIRLDDFGDAQLFEDKTIYSSILLLQNKAQEEFIYSNVVSATSLWAREQVDSITLKTTSLDDSIWKLTTDLEFLSLLQRLNDVAVPLEAHADIFNGIQTSAERPTPIFWFPAEIVRRENKETVIITRDGQDFMIEKALLKPYFKPTKKAEKGLNSYSILSTDKRIIFPYDEQGRLISKGVMEESYPGTYAYLCHYYNRLVPRSVSPEGTRDVPNATTDTWYQYGRTQALTAFIDTPKLIVGVLSKEPMYSYDGSDMLIASGGTAGYCAVKQKAGSPYALEYLQAWLSNPYTEQYIRIIGSDFEGGFIARGTSLLSALPFVELDFSIPAQKGIYEKVVNLTHEIYALNDNMTAPLARGPANVLSRRKKSLIDEIESLISRVYRLEF